MSYIDINCLWIETMVDASISKWISPTLQTYSECPVTMDSEVEGEAHTQVVLHPFVTEKPIVWGYISTKRHQTSLGTSKNHAVHFLTSSWVFSSC